MHEARVVRMIVERIDDLAKAEHADHIDSVRIEIGALSHITPESLSGHFELLAAHSPADGARLDITRSTDQHDPDAHDVRLVSVTLNEA